MTTAYCQQSADYVTILAIYDEQDDCTPDSTTTSRFIAGGAPGSSSTSSPITIKTTSAEKGSEFKSDIFPSSSDGDVVEITSLADPPSEGLRVLSDTSHAMEQQPSSSSSLNRSDYSSGTIHYEQKRSVVSSTGKVYMSSLKGANSSPRTKHRVMISPEVERKFIKAHSGSSMGQPSAASADLPSRLARSSARKSRITDSFFEAKERIEEKLAELTPNTEPSSMDKVIPAMQAANPKHTVIVLPDWTINRDIGIEISAVEDQEKASRLLAVEVRRIDEDGRVAADGRIRVGDLIVEINQRPVYQMSISRARAYLHELSSIAHPTLTIDRPLQTFQNTTAAEVISHRSQTSSSSTYKKPILSALQQANTSTIGVTSSVEVVKSSQGFGFTVLSRDNAKGERLFYIGTVKASGPAMGLLKSGDRLLEINGESTTGLKQQDVVDRLKRFNLGEMVKLLISRINADEDDGVEGATANSKANNSEKAASGAKSDAENEAPESGKATSSNSRQKESKNEEILDLDIALNDTGSAGLGVSLKARAVMKQDGTRHDCGIFIKKVLHGGAAYKDGRLRVNDQLIGIEDIDLRALKKNAEASDAITKCFKAIGPNAASVHLRVARAVDSASQTIGTTLPVDGAEDSTNAQKTSIHSITRVEIPRLRVEGYGDYATVVKNGSSTVKKQNDSTGRKGSESDDRKSPHEDANSALDEQQCPSDDEVSRIDEDAFDRENPARRSISEKRHMGSSNDPSHTLIFQKIKHSRQTSASPKRRSMSLESMTSKSAAATEQAMVYEVITGSKKPLPSALKKVQRSRAPNYSFRQAVDASQKVDEGTAADYEEVDKVSMEPNVSFPRRSSITAVSKEKQQRRKSVGSSLFSKISQKLGGSRSRDASPEKSPSFDILDSKEVERKRQEEERKRIQDQYDRLKQKQQNRDNSSSNIARIPPPSVLSYAISHQTGPFVGFEPNPQEKESPSEGEEKERDEQGAMPECGFIRVANSKFYSSVERVSLAKQRAAQCSQDTNNTDTPATINTQTANQLMGHIPITTTDPVMQATLTGTLLSSSSHNHNMAITDSTVDINATPVDQVPIITTRSMPGSHTAVQQPVTVCNTVAPKEASVVFIPDTVSPTDVTRAHHKERPTRRPEESNMKDSDRVLASSLHHRTRDTAPPHPSTHPVDVRRLPVAFPTSRTVFMPSVSASHNNTQAENTAQRSSLRHRPKPTGAHRTSKVSSSNSPFERQLSSSLRQANPHHPSSGTSASCEKRIPKKLDTGCMISKYGRTQSAVQQPTVLPRNAIGHLPKKVQSNRASADIGGVVTFVGPSPTSPLYLQTLLESPFGTSSSTTTNPPVRNIRIQRVSALKTPQPPYGERPLPVAVHMRPKDFPTTEGAQASDSDLFNSLEFDYKRLLRPVRRDRAHEQRQRVTLISTPGEYKSTL